MNGVMDIMHDDRQHTYQLLENSKADKYLQKAIGLDHSDHCPQ